MGQIRHPAASSRVPAVAAIVLAATGAWLLLIGRGRPAVTPPAPPPAASPAAAPEAVVRPAVVGPLAVPGPSTAGGASRTATIAGLTRSRPVELDIPAIGVHTPLSLLGLNRDGTVAVPPLGSRAPAGWYRYLSSPGEVGPAVILGHVDSARDGPAVFYRLGELRPGDRITVTRQDRTQVRFVVTGAISVPKRDFPSGAVYGPVGYPALRLVTCGGSFDPARHSYRDNVIVFARMVTAEQTGRSSNAASPRAPR